MTYEPGVDQIRREQHGYPERIVPDVEEPGVLASHLKRYEFALPWCEGKEVLDAACGVGYGTAVLAERARRVAGVDISKDALEYARTHYASANAEFLEMDLLRLDIADDAFEVVCSFETIEHVGDVDRYLDEVTRVLAQGGTYIVSTPRVAVTSENPGNPHHVKEFSEADFETLLRKRFADVELYGERHRFNVRRTAVRSVDRWNVRQMLPQPVRTLAGRLLGGKPPATVELPSDEIVIAQDGREWASEIVAVCVL